MNFAQSFERPLADIQLKTDTNIKLFDLNYISLFCHGEITEFSDYK